MRVLRELGVLVGIVVVLGSGARGGVWAQQSQASGAAPNDVTHANNVTFKSTAARLARGKYLVEGPAHCFDCHSEHDLSTPLLPIVESKRGSGWELPIPELNNPSSKNITSDKE